jgi:ferrous iron transport protein A
MRTASQLKFGEKVFISDIDETHPSHKRLIEIGFTPGQQIELMNTSLFNDPVAFSVRGSIIAIRKSEANCILIK